MRNGNDLPEQERSAPSKSAAQSAANDAQPAESETQDAATDAQPDATEAGDAATDTQPAAPESQPAAPETQTTAPETQPADPEKKRRTFNINISLGGPGWPLILLVVVTALVWLCFFAISEDGDFPGADMIRSVAETTGQVASVLVNHRDTRDERIAHPDPAQRHLPLKELMLELTNRKRAEAGAPPVRLGENPAAQLHAEAAMDGCYASHWDRWGLKPQHRYSLSGGTGAGAENVTGLDYCVRLRDWRMFIMSMEEEVARAVEEWMRSPDHRRILLHPAHTTMNMGIAHDRFNANLVQHFGSDYVKYDREPAIDSDGMLRLSGRVSGATLEIEQTVKVQIAYDPPPGFLTTGQLAHTYALCNPVTVAHLAEPPRSEELPAASPVITELTWRRCVDPYDTPADRPPPDSPAEANKALTASLAASDAAEPIQTHSLRIYTERLGISADRFDAQADLTPVLSDKGPGIYTIRLWGRPNHMGEAVPLSERSIFWQTAPPPGAPY